MSFSLLALVNLLSRGPGGVRRVASDLQFGPSRRERLSIYAPASSAAPTPVVLFLYGGSWSEGDRRDYAFAGRALAARGYTVVLPDYRVVPEVEYPVFLEDCAAALRWTRDNIAAYGGDPARLGLMGHSAGAYNAVMLALDRGLGVSDIPDAVVGLSGPYDFFPFDVKITVRTFGAVPDPLATQPVNLVSSAAPPMFLGHGDADKLVYSRNTVALAARLRDVGVEVEERHYAGLNHAQPLLEIGTFLGGRSGLFDDVTAFLGRHLR